MDILCYDPVKCVFHSNCTLGNDFQCNNITELNVPLYFPTVVYSEFLNKTCKIIMCCQRALCSSNMLLKSNFSDYNYSDFLIFKSSNGDDFQYKLAILICLIIIVISCMICTLLRYLCRQ